MTIETLFLLSSGLFLGWSLGANDAGNVFGTAVGSRMIRFSTAVVVCSIFMVLGAVWSGEGVSRGLVELGSVNVLGGAFMVALAAAIAVFLMLRTGIQVSTTQALIGSLLGWNAFAGVATDITVFLQVVSTWVLGPLLAAAMAMAMMWAAKLILRNSRIGLIRLDGYTRLALLGSGALGAYSLGANNIANVVAVFLPSQPFPALSWQGFESSPTQLLLLVGGIAMASGVLTYSRRTIELVGSGLANLSPLAAWVCVSAHSLVLLLFASASLKAWLDSMGLPSLPLVPISSSQAILGAILGVGLLRGGREVNWGTVGRVALGWLVTPLVASLLCFLGLFVLQNVFLLQVVGG